MCHRRSRNKHVDDEGNSYFMCTSISSGGVADVKKEMRNATHCQNLPLPRIKFTVMLMHSIRKMGQIMLFSSGKVDKKIIDCIAYFSSCQKYMFQKIKRKKKILRVIFWKLYLRNVYCTTTCVYYIK